MFSVRNVLSAKESPFSSSRGSSLVPSISSFSASAAILHNNESRDLDVWLRKFVFNWFTKVSMVDALINCLKIRLRYMSSHMLFFTLYLSSSKVWCNFVPGIKLLTRLLLSAKPKAVDGVCRSHRMFSASLLRS